MNITILTIGTRGDVQPFVALGTRLTGAGHEVALAAEASRHTSPSTGCTTPAWTWTFSNACNRPRAGPLSPEETSSQR
jgi:hypothetical protein